MRDSLFALMLAFTAIFGVAGCGSHLAYNLPPAQQLMHPGPGVDGPGPGVIPVSADMTMGGVPAGYYGGGAAYLGGGPMTTQVAFVGEESLQISWDVSGQGMFDSVPLVTPGRQDFSQAAIYRLRLSNIPGRPGIELYPTLEIAPVTPRTDAYLAHSPVPVQFTQEDFDQAIASNFVTKVIYLPDPEFQELALAGVETLVSNRLDPGVDPIAEADRRGSILAILRMGNKDLQSGYGGGLGGGLGDGAVMHAGYEDDFSGEPAKFDPEGQPLTATPAGYNEAASYNYYAEAAGGGHPGGGYMGGGYIDAGMSGAPLGMPTAGFAPPAVPPNLVAGAGAQWGMPISGTPIGLPGPPHVPLGVPAGMQRHIMKNRTRIAVPPPVSKVKLSVKQRPGMNYPHPVNKVSIDEVNRQPFHLFGTVPSHLSTFIKSRFAAERLPHHHH